MIQEEVLQLCGELVGPEAENPPISGSSRPEVADRNAGKRKRLIGHHRKEVDGAGSGESGGKLSAEVGVEAMTPKASNIRRIRAEGSGRGCGKRKRFLGHPRKRVVGLLDHENRIFSRKKCLTFQELAFFVLLAKQLTREP